MNFRSLLLSFLPQLIQFKGFFPNLNVVTKEENGGEEAKTRKIKSNLKGLFMYPQVPSLGSFLAKDKDIKVIFIQNRLLVLLIDQVCRLLKALL
jgi:hypothetical protein